MENQLINDIEQKMLAHLDNKQMEQLHQVLGHFLRGVMAAPEQGGDKMKTGINLISEERERQIAEEGWTAEHDSQHESSELAWAACYYAMPCMIMERCGCGAIIKVTPEVMYANTGWEDRWAKRHGFDDRIRDLVKAGALIAAEIDRSMRHDSLIDKDAL
jgi:hypothetical protein